MKDKLSYVYGREKSVSPSLSFVSVNQKKKRQSLFLSIKHINNDIFFKLFSQTGRKKLLHTYILINFLLTVIFFLLK